MNQDPEHEDYDDDEYNYYPQYNEYGYPEYSKKFNIDWAAWEKWLSETIKSIMQEDINKWSPPIKKKNQKNKLIYFGTNFYDESVWKAEYFVNKKLDQDFKNHIVSHASYFLKQPNYYKGLFDNLN